MGEADFGFLVSALEKADFSFLAVALVEADFVFLASLKEFLNLTSLPFSTNYFD